MPESGRTSPGALARSAAGSSVLLGELLVELLELQMVDIFFIFLALSKPVAWIEFAFHQATFTLPPMIQPHNSHQKQEFACSQDLSELPEGLVKQMLTLRVSF